MNDYQIAYILISIFFGALGLFAMYMERKTKKIIKK